MKFKIGDKVRIVRKSSTWNSMGEMDKWLGKVMTIRETRVLDYRMEEDRAENCGEGWFFDEICLELETTQILTITTSDRVTTLTDGILTVSVSRYYLDKDNRKVASREVLDKYFDELDRIDEEKKSPKVGDTVTVTNAGSVYSVYKEWLVKNNVSIESAIKWESNKRPKKGDIFKITKLAERVPRPGSQIIYLIENGNSAFLMNGRGIEVVKE